MTTKGYCLHYVVGLISHMVIIFWNLYLFSHFFKTKLSQMGSGSYSSSFNYTIMKSFHLMLCHTYCTVRSLLGRLCPQKIKSVSQIPSDTSSVQHPREATLIRLCC